MKLAKETALYNEGAVEQVSETADTAKTIATDTAQYFWTSSDGTDNGAHITEIPKEQFESSPSGGNLLATSNGIAVRDGLTERAQFGETVVLGETTNSHQEIDYHSLKLIDREGETYFFVSDLRNQNGYVEVTEKFIADTSTTEFTVSMSVNSPAGYTPTITDGINDIPYTLNDKTFTVSYTFVTAVLVEITYITTDSKAKAFTFGKRERINSIGALSVAEGYDVTASGYCSHAEGDSSSASGYCSHAEGKSTANRDYSHAEGTQTTASGTSSHAEGTQTTASGNPSHAEGYNTTASGGYSHSEGRNTLADGDGSHAEGYASQALGGSSHAEGANSSAVGAVSHAEGYHASAKGDYSHAQNYYTIASSTAQTAIGKYNTEDTADQYSFIIGNGSATNMRSNALTVDWNGNVVIAGTLTQSSDRRLKKHVAYLDEDAVEFIRKLKPAHFVKDEEDHVGFYAQDVEKEDKWNCMTGEMNGYKTLGYTEIIAPLVAYCQHLEARIDELERKQNG